MPGMTGKPAGRAGVSGGEPDASGVVVGATDGASEAVGVGELPAQPASSAAANTVAIARREPVARLAVGGTGMTVLLT
jgi:hypothetical protein